MATITASFPTTAVTDILFNALLEKYPIVLHSACIEGNFKLVELECGELHKEAVISGLKVLQSPLIRSLNELVWDYLDSMVSYEVWVKSGSTTCQVAQTKEFEEAESIALTWAEEFTNLSAWVVKINSRTNEEEYFTIK